MMGFNKALFNVVITGLGFMLVFTAFQTGAMIQPKVLDTLSLDTKNTTHPFTGDGYTSLCIIYLVFAFANWIAAPIVAVIGPRIGMFCGALIYSGFIASFISPQTWLLYVMSSLLGIAAAVIWTAQGNYLTLNSTDKTMSTNSGIFWALFQSSLIFGNLFVHFEFAQSGDHIDKQTRMIVYSVLTGTGVLGTLLLLVLRKPVNEESGAVINSALGGDVSPWRKMVDELITAFKLLFTKDMLLLFCGFFYTGIELTFFSGVYSTCVSQTGHFGEVANSYIGYSGMLIGAGEILGGLLFGILGSMTNKYGRDLIVMLGFLVHMVAFMLIFINLPDDAPLVKTPTYTPAYITPSAFIALLCSFLLGFGDSCFNTQIYSILGVKYADQSGAAFALFKFSQSLAAAIAFFYSSHLLMKWQLLILVITGFIGSCCFYPVEWSLRKSKTDRYEQLSD